MMWARGAGRWEGRQCKLAREVKKSSIPFLAPKGVDRGARVSSPGLKTWAKGVWGGGRSVSQRMGCQEGGTMAGDAAELAGGRVCERS